MNRILTLFFVLSAFLSIGQNAIVEGVVSDRDGLLIPGANVVVKDNKQLGTSTNPDGQYRLELPPGNYTLIISFVGYSTRELDLKLETGQRVIKNIQLLKGVTITTIEILGEGERSQPIQRIEPKVAARIPSPRGTIEDLLMQAPVSFTSELSSSYNVRGGSFDENLVYVNDIQVYRPFLVRAGQQEGLSFPNPDMVDNILFSAGGFESKYGDRMSSVLDIKYRKPTDFGGAVTMGLMGLSVQLEDINKKKTFSHNSGFRYRNNSYVLGTLDERGDYNPTYLDFQTYLTWNPDEHGPWEFHFLGNISRNRYNFIPQTRETDVGTINEALRLTVFFDGQENTGFNTFFGAFSADRISDVSKLTFIASAFQTYEYETFDINGQYSLDELERDLGSDGFGEVLANRGVGGFLNHARNDLDATVFNFTHKGSLEVGNRRHFLEWGATAQIESINDRLSEWSLLDSAGYNQPYPNDSIGYETPGLVNDQEIILTNVVKATNDVSSLRAMAYIQNTWSRKNAKGEDWNFNFGLRGNYWTFNNEFVGGPRAHLSYIPKWHKDGNDTLKLRDVVFNLAGGYYYQPAFYREMRGYDGTVNANIEAQRSIHVVGGVNYIFTAFDRPFKLVGEVYYKGLNNIIPYEVDNVRLRYTARNEARGFATGMDIMLNGEFIPGIQSWMRMSVLRTAENIDNDNYYQYINSDGETIVAGFTSNNVAVDSTLVDPGFIPRPTDQRFNISMLFQDEMPKWPEYKVFVSLFFGTGLPFGPPNSPRYLDVLRTNSYRRVDIGFSRDLFLKPSDERKMKWVKSGFIALEIFNILGINNTINHTWIEDVNGRQYGIPNFLTGRRLNVKFSFNF
ncbi:MAG: TonB-dependent receptor [Cryomorphaceae bacterium]|nr:TonB-dependent receptor [Cryomorphaceae bacterium]